MTTTYKKYLYQKTLRASLPVNPIQDYRTTSVLMIDGKKINTTITYNLVKKKKMIPFSLCCILMHLLYRQLSKLHTIQ
jgi:hypothetical protein